MDELLSHEVQPALIHGDLWSGNYLADEKGNPVLLDPAVYFADRESRIRDDDVVWRVEPLFLRCLPGNVAHASRVGRPNRNPIAYTIC